MEGTYPVSLNGERIGAVVLQRQGLYYRLNCRCNGVHKDMMQLMIQAKNTVKDIGLLIPNGNMLEIRTTIPVKRIGDNTPTFFLHSRQGSTCQFYSVDPQTPFSHLAELDRAVFAIRNDQIGVEIDPEKYKKKDEI